MTRRGIAATAALSWVVAGCVAAASPTSPTVTPSLGSSSATSRSLSPPPLQASVMPSKAVSPTVSPSAVPTVGPSPGSPELDYPHEDADLERYLPDRMGETPLIRLSVPGSFFMPGGDFCLLLCGNEPADFAKALGIPIERVTVALATSETGGIGGVAMRAKGVATGQLAAAGVQIKGGVVGGGSGSFPIVVDGRHVTYLDRMDRGQYLVPIGDVLVFLYGEPPTTSPNHISPNGTVPPEVVALIAGLPR